MLGRKKQTSLLLLLLTLVFSFLTAAVIYSVSSAQALQDMEKYIIDTQAHSNAALAERIADLELQQKNSRMQIDALTKQVDALQAQLHQTETKEAAQ